MNPCNHTNGGNLRKACSDNVLVEFTKVCRSFGQKEVLNNISFTLHSGEVLTLVGPNGAGKTTIVRLLLGLLRCHCGDAFVLGNRAWSMPISVRSQIGVLLDHSGLYSNMSGKQNLHYFGELYGLSTKEINIRITRALCWVGFEDDLNKTVSKLSMGNRQKIALARAIMIEPKLLVLDEPTSGLDPLAQRDVREMIQQFAEEKKVALFITSHNMPEVARVANNVMVLKDGKVIALGTPEQLIKEQGYVIEVDLRNNCDSASDVIKLLEQNGEWYRVEQVSSTKLHLYTKKERNTVRLATSILRSKGFAKAFCTQKTVTLEEAYCQLMERK